MTRSEFKIRRGVCVPFTANERTRCRGLVSAAATCDVTPLKRRLAWNARISRTTHAAPCIAEEQRGGFSRPGGGCSALVHPIPPFPFRSLFLCVSAHPLGSLFFFFFYVRPAIPYIWHFHPGQGIAIRSSARYRRRFALRSRGIYARSSWRSIRSGAIYFCASEGDPLT